MESGQQDPKKSQLIHLAILVSGQGSNMQAILEAISNKKITGIRPCVVISSRPHVPALAKAEACGVPSIYIASKKNTFESTKDDFTQQLIDCLNNYEVTPEKGLICLAGFMKILNKRFVDLYRGRLLNIHPSLLPSFPGLDAVGQALKYGVKVTGCTVHVVDEGVDTGKILKQAAVEVKEDDTHDILQARIHAQEHEMYPEAIAEFVQSKLSLQ